MKNIRKIKKEIKKRLDEETEFFDEMETESAPSGEWAEYNYGFLVQEATVGAWEEAYEIVRKIK